MWSCCISHGHDAKTIQTHMAVDTVVPGRLVVVSHTDNRQFRYVVESHWIVNC